MYESYVRGPDDIDLLFCKVLRILFLDSFRVADNSGVR
jgi:hypothetical protein